jgi:pimeloyl-ACP methyl ester carboxylesterase
MASGLTLSQFARQGGAMTDPTTAIARDDSAIPEHIEHRIRTSDGRTIAVAEWGDPKGVSLIAFHGTPGGRISWWEDPTIYARHGLRRLTFDRPGYGESTRLPGRGVADVVPDVVAIADALGVDRFAITGGSGGGPHVLACAALLPDRVIRCQAAVSIAPYGMEGLDWLAGMTEGNVIEFRAALAGEPAMRVVADREARITVERLTAGRADFMSDAYEMSDADVAQMEKHRVRIAAHVLNALAPGVDGWVDDMIAFTQPWGFEVGDIAVPVYLQYGRDDNLVPAAHGDWLSAHIRTTKVAALESGHLGDDSLVESDMAWLAGESA